MSQTNDRTATPEPVRTDKARSNPLIERLIGRSRAALWWERVWPALWLPLSVVLVFLSAVWFGLLMPLEPAARAVVVGLSLVALLASFIPLVRLKAPATQEAVARLDRDAAGAHRPVSAALDSLSIGANDPVTQALWRAHQARRAAELASIKVAAPAPGMVRLDRRAFRFAPMIAAVAALFVAGPDAGDRLQGAFQFRAPEPPPPAVRIDAWIDPPGYTRLPPVMLTFQPGDGPVRAPERSNVIVRITGAAKAEVETTGGLEAQPTPAGVREGVERRFALTGDASLRIVGAGVGGVETVIAAVPDTAPQVTITEAPQSGQRGQMTVFYRAQDDYGIASVEALFKPVGPARPGARPLIEPPRMPLQTPGDTASDVDVKATLELAEHPWAGARVSMTLIARDDAGQEGVSAAREVTLPQRAFSKPLAKALVELRRWLVLDVTARPKSQTALDALLIEPSIFTTEAGQYLALRAVTEKLRAARGDEQLVAVVNDLWQLALLLEDGDLSDAERELRAAQERLEQAMERGASPEELSRLTRELREALDRYMRQLAEQMQRDMQQQGQQNEMARVPENFRTITPRDLNNMLDRIDELNRRGETEEAQRLLNELNNILRNLQMARPGQMDPRQREMQNQLSELDRMTRDQQGLRDETFQEGQEQRNQRARPNQRGQQQARPGQQPGQQPGQRQQGQQRGQQPGQQPGEGGDQQDGQMGQNGQQGRGDQLAQRQQQLRDRLQQLQRRMQGSGSPGQQGLQDAERAMGEADGALQQGDMDGAAEAQGRALEGLRGSADQLAQQMQQEGEGQGEGEGYADGDPTPGGRDRANSRQTQQRDPLGRDGSQREQSRGLVSGDTRVPGEAPQVRARRILEELRRRLGESLRPQDEIEYLERLLRPR
jgi:uncharacterized protein (TIGR02302 family)